VTISGFNAALDRIDLVDGAGSVVSASQLKGIEATATSVSGGTLYRVSPIETIFVESPVFGSSTWFSEQNQALTISDSISASVTQTSGTTTGSSGTAGLGNSSTTVGGSGGSGVGNTSIPVTTIVNGAYATIAGANNVAFVDSISGTTVNATMTDQTETITMTGGANTINAIGGPGAGMFPTYGNILMTGDNNIMSVTGGRVTISGSHDAVMIPYTYGYLSINLFGTGDTVSTSSLTNPAIDIEGSGNLANFNSESVTDTIGGTNNTVTAGTYSLIDVTGKADDVTITGETQATVSGTGNIINVTSGFHKIVAANVTGTPNLYEVGGSVGGSVTISGYNPSLDKLRVLDSSGNAVSQSTINQIIADATTGAGAPNILKLSTGTTVLFLDLTSGTGNISSSWFEQTIPPTPIAGPTTIDGGTVIQNAGNQTILGATANIVDTVSGAAIDARRTNQQETLMLSGSAVTVNAVGAAGAENFPAYGNLFLSGNNDLVSVTAGTTTDTGNGNIINVPWQFGGGSIVELGKNATITAGANTSIPINLEGSNNTATINAQTALQTIGGSSNTVTAGTYAQLDVTGTADQASISGEVSATLSGSADTVMATGFNKVLMTGTGDIISIPGGSWTAQDTVTGMADTVVAGGTSSTGDNQMSLFLGANNETIVTTGLEMSTISGGVGGLNLVAGGASNLVIGGPGNDAITASGGNTTLRGGSGPVDVFGNGGNITIQNVGKNISIHDGGTMTIDLTGGSTAIDLYGTQGGSPGTITIKNYQQSDVIRYAAAPGGLFTNISGPTSGTSSKPLVLSDGTSISFL
jgi:hypothetical protein